MSNYPVCIFCNKNDSPSSKEDVIPKWIARELPDTLITVTQPELGRTFKARGHIGIVCDKPCRRCNNGWMSRLEHAVKPILAPLMDGTTSALSKKQQMIVARWLLKTAVMFELTRNEPPYYFTTQDRNALCQSLAIPPHTRMYLARYVGARGGHVFDALGEMTISGDRGAEVSQGYSMTFAVKQLALQIFSLRWPKKLNFSQVQIPHAHNWDGVTVPLWPISDNFLRWPPRLVLDDQHLDLFADRWRTL